MQLLHSRFREWQKGKGLLAAFFVLWLVYGTFAVVSPSLHRLLHDDAGQSSHECALTIFEKHQVLSCDPVISFAIPSSIDQALPKAERSILISSIDTCNYPSRAPPF